MLNIVIGDKKYKYVNSAKIDDNCYIAYTDGEYTYISGFHFEGDTIIIEEIDDETFRQVKEVLS